MKRPLLSWLWYFEVDCCFCTFHPPSCWRVYQLWKVSWFHRFICITLFACHHHFRCIIFLTVFSHLLIIFCDNLISNQINLNTLMLSFFTICIAQANSVRFLKFKSKSASLLSLPPLVPRPRQTQDVYIPSDCSSAKCLASRITGLSNMTLKTCGRRWPPSLLRPWALSLGLHLQLMVSVSIWVKILDRT